jgi:hypothetical protein
MKQAKPIILLDTTKVIVMNIKMNINNSNNNIVILIILVNTYIYISSTVTLLLGNMALSTPQIQVVYLHHTAFPVILCWLFFGGLAQDK